MTLTLDNHSRNKESSLTKALRQIQQLNSKIHELEEQHQVQALRIVIYRGEAACRQYLRSVLVKQSQASKMTTGQIKKPTSIKRAKNQGFLQNSKK
jgi:hypothetical protein